MRYVTGKIPGITRRLRALAVPPAYTDAWICPMPNGHLQATGLDARGRKRCAYHKRWRELCDETKFDRMTAFAQALPRIRKRAEEDLPPKHGRGSYPKSVSLSICCANAPKRATLRARAANFDGRWKNGKRRLPEA